MERRAICVALSIMLIALGGGGLFALRAGNGGDLEWWLAAWIALIAGLGLMAYLLVRGAGRGGGDRAEPPPPRIVNINLFCRVDIGQKHKKKDAR